MGIFFKDMQHELYESLEFASSLFVLLCLGPVPSPSSYEKQCESASGPV